MKYKVLRPTEIEFDDIEEVLDYCMCKDYYDTDSYSDEFRDYINNSCDEIEMFGIELSPYDVLDATGHLYAAEYDFKDWMYESEHEYFEGELRDALSGDTICIQGHEVYCFDEDEEEDEESVAEREESTFDEPTDEDINRLMVHLSVHKNPTKLQCLEKIRAEMQESNRKLEQDMENAKNTENDYLNLFQTIAS